MLSYPLAATEISEALADVPQAQMLTISFGLYEPMDQRGKPRDILVVRYAGASSVRTEPPITDQWSISVAPVPRVIRHQVNARLREEALPAIRA
jgi:hypothetical protein